jgi:hypothetical protein
MNGNGAHNGILNGKYNGTSDRTSSGETPPFDAPEPTVDSGDQQETLPTEHAGKLFYYDHGFTNGVLKTDAAGFEQFISAARMSRLSIEKLSKIQQEMAQLRQLIDETKAEAIARQETVINCSNDVQLLQWKEATLIKERAAGEEQRRLCEAENSGIKPPHGSLVAWLLLVAGTVFVLADISITHGIFYNALDMAYMEALILAIGLSFIAFILKPVVDRVFETPYLAGENKKLNHRFLLVVGFVALVSLGFLGYYRSVAYQFEKVVSGLQAERDGILNNYIGELPSDAASTVSAIDASIQSQSLLQIDHWAIITVFTLSSILFALSGAICFSIGFPLRSAHRRKRQLDAEIRRLTASLATTGAQIADNRQQLSEKQSRQEQAEFILSLLPDLAKLREQLQDLRQREWQLLEDNAAQLTDMEKAWYLEGYRRGEQYQLTDKLQISPVTFEGVLSPTNSNRTKGPRKWPSRASARAPGYTQMQGNYLHQHLRNMIDYNFTKSKQNGNGHED